MLLIRTTTTTARKEDKSVAARHQQLNQAAAAEREAAFTISGSHSHPASVQVGLGGSHSHLVLAHGDTAGISSKQVGLGKQF